MFRRVSYRAWITRFILLVGLIASPSYAQRQSARYLERFDSTTPPSLPAGWSSSGTRTTDGDLTLTLAGAHSPPGCVVGTNASVAQWLSLHPLDLRGWRECTLRWMERRSATHDGSLIVEASLDGGTGYSPLPADTIRPSGGTSYVERSVPIPEWCWERDSVGLRWRMTGEGAGATGTIRFDDVVITGRPRRDLSLSAGAISPPRPLAGVEFSCSGYVVNAGYDVPGEWTLAWGPDLDGNGALDESEVRGSAAPGPVLPGDSAEFAFTLQRGGPVPLTLIALIRSDSDMAAENDTARFLLPAAVAPASVIINEIMYDPAPGRAEYVELYNRSGESLDLRGWRLSDREDDSTSGRLGADDLLLPPGGYLLCSPDSTMTADYPDIPDGSGIIGGTRGFTLNNAGDRLILADESGGIIDRVDYVPEWHTPALDDTRGRSLERMTSERAGSGAWNWGTSAGASGGTPGYRNSLSTGFVTRDDRLSCSPNPFSPDGDGFEDVTGISYRLAGGPLIARVRIFDADGRPVRTITGGDYVTGAGSFAWNGYDDRGRRVPIGIYVILLDGVDAAGNASVAARGVVVVAGRL